MTAPRRARLTDVDRAAWAHYARHVRPLAGRTLPELALPATHAAASPSAPAPAPPSPRPARAALSYVTTGTQPPGVDNANWQRFRTGKLAAQRTLDLHGRTAHRAYHALEAFLRVAHADRLRCVEVITGRGSGEEGGVLRRELPLWLNLPQLRPLILGAAHPHPANPGSVRLLLKRIR